MGGWYDGGGGLEAEYLGTELGVYTGPYQLIGRLSAEMWSACRLVVDTGIHARGWPLGRAADYMAARTVTSRANIEAEVRRFRRDESDSQGPYDSGSDREPHSGSSSSSEASNCAPKPDVEADLGHPILLIAAGN